MPIFTYKTKNSAGETIKGQREAADKYELYKALKIEGLEAVSVEEKKQGTFGQSMLHFSIGGRVKTQDKINFARNLGLMLKAGLALSRALSVLERQSKNKALKKVLNDLIENINKGMSFADSLEKHPKVFSQLFSSMIHAGEQSGTLAESLKAVADQMDSSYTLTRRIRGAMMYPAVIFCVMIVIGILMMIFVIPTLLSTFESLGAPLPPTTQFILNMSNVFQRYGIFILIGLAAVAYVWYLWSKKPSGKKVIHMAILKMPIVGPLAQEVNSARTARTLSSLLHSGVGVVESVTITAAVIQNVYFRAVLERAKEAIKKGELMSKTFEAHDKLYPVFFAEMLSVGEETGKMDEMLLNVATFYEDDVNQKTKDMSTIIEPLMIVFIGAAVGFFAVSMIEPMYSLVNVIH
ncbi:MAG: type II secretion system F family protein [Candidatus Pacebacteria bacterium]|nr:type II secretion system F family protein [Candidatus Paceibacterota bacterium]